MKASSGRRIVAATAILIIVMMILYPPWVTILPPIPVMRSPNSPHPMVMPQKPRVIYSWIWKPPGRNMAIHVRRLVAQCVFVALVAVLVMGRVRT